MKTLPAPFPSHIIFPLISFLIAVFYVVDAAAFTIPLPGDCTSIHNSYYTDPTACVSNPNFSLFLSSGCIAFRVMAQVGLRMECSLSQAVEPVMTAFVTMYIIFYSMAFMFNIADTSLKDGVIRFIKVGFIYALVTDLDVWFTYFYEPLHVFWYSFLEFLSSNPQLWQKAFNSEPILPQDYVDQVIGGQRELWIFLLIDTVAWVLNSNPGTMIMTLIALAFIASGVGMYIGILLLMAIVSILISMINITITFVTATVGVTFLTMLFPFFGGFLLFKPTARIFKSYLAAIISFIFQTIIIVFYLILTIKAFTTGNTISLENYYYNDPAACAEATARDPNAPGDNTPGSPCARDKARLEYVQEETCADPGEIACRCWNAEKDVVRCDPLLCTADDVSASCSGGGLQIIPPQIPLRWCNCVKGSPISKEAATRQGYTLLKSWVIVTMYAPKFKGLTGEMCNNPPHDIPCKCVDKTTRADLGEECSAGADPSVEPLIINGSVPVVPYAPADPPCNCIKENITQFLKSHQQLFAWVVAFLVLNAITNAMLKESIRIAYSLSIWENYFAVPSIGENKILDFMKGSDGGGDDWDRATNVGVKKAGAGHAYSVNDGLLGKAADAIERQGNNFVRRGGITGGGG